jgi:hypothetical protein
MTMIPAFLLQGDSGPAVGGGLLAMGGTMVLVMLAIGVVFLVAAWKVYVKAGQPGWAVLIPFYNFYIWLKIAGRPGWWLVLLLIPLVNLVIMVILAVDVAKAFGKSAVFGVVLLFLLGGIGCLILGFGNARYVKPATAVAR